MSKYGARYIKIDTIFRSVLNEGDVHGNGDDVADNEQRTKISNATVPYLEHFHKLLIDPPYVRVAFRISTFLISFSLLYCLNVYYTFQSLFIFHKLVNTLF